MLPNFEFPVSASDFQSRCPPFNPILHSTQKKKGKKEERKGEGDRSIILYSPVPILFFAVERIQNIKRTGESFEYPEGFDPEALLESAFDMVYGDPVKVRIWFSADQVRYVKERKWSKNQEIVDQEDGSIILSMETSGWWDVKRWVLSCGRTAKVLEPEDLKGIKGQVNNTPTIKIHIHWEPVDPLITARNDKDNRIRVYKRRKICWKGM